MSASFVAEVDPAELAIRMCEAQYNIKRPCSDAYDALAAMDDDCRDGWIRAAIVALEYIQECLAKGQKPS